MSQHKGDSAKRENPADNVWELKQLKKKYDKRDNKNRHVRPLFFKYIDDYKGYNNSYHVYREFGDEYEKVYDTDSYTEAYDLAREEDSLTVCKGHMDYQFMRSTMDMIDKSISKFKRGMDKRYGNSYEMRNEINKIISFEDCLLPLSYFNINSVDYKQLNAICDEIIPEYIQMKQELLNTITNFTTRYSALKELENSFYNKIQSMRINVHTARELIRRISFDKYSSIHRFIFKICFSLPLKGFFGLIINSRENVCCLKELTCGHYIVDNIYYIYDLPFTKEYR